MEQAGDRNDPPFFPRDSSSGTQPAARLRREETRETPADAKGGGASLITLPYQQSVGATPLRRYKRSL
jgi:hypothetical protein